MPSGRHKLDPQLLGEATGQSSPNCVRCGKPTGTVSLVCMACLVPQFMAQALEQARDVYRQDRGRLVELAFDRRHVRHLVLPLHKWVAWCGAEVTEAKSKRKREAPDKLPGFLCEACLKVFDEMRADVM